MNWWQWVIAGAGGFFVCFVLLPFMILQCVRAIRVGWYGPVADDDSQYNSHPNQRRESNGKTG